jgi:hypothetical protein
MNVSVGIGTVRRSFLKTSALTDEAVTSDRRSNTRERRILASGRTNTDDFLETP